MEQYWGSEIGTNRQTPEETDIGMIAHYFEKYQFDGLIIVGGFEAFVSLEQLKDQELCIHRSEFYGFNPCHHFK